MRLSAEEARARLSAAVHGTLCTLHPERGPDPVPVVFAVSGDFVGVPIDSVKPKASTRLQREDNLAADPRASLLVEHWDAEDWSRLWWVRAQLQHENTPRQSLVDGLADRLSTTVPQYVDKPFHRIVVCRIVAVSGWAVAED